MAQKNKGVNAVENGDNPKVLLDEEVVEETVVAEKAETPVEDVKEEIKEEVVEETPQDPYADVDPKVLMMMGMLYKQNKVDEKVKQRGIYSAMNGISVVRS